MCPSCSDGFWRLKGWGTTTRFYWLPSYGGGGWSFPREIFEPFNNKWYFATLMSIYFFLWGLYELFLVVGFASVKTFKGTVVIPPRREAVE